MLITVVEPTFDLIGFVPEEHWVYRFIEECGRTCYKSEDRITTGSAERFVKALLNRPDPHVSVIEHFHITARITCSRACSHQLVRHRIAAYSQESQRYCDYGKKGLQVICPPSIGVAPGSYTRVGSWHNGWSADGAKTVLDYPRSLWMDTINDAYEAYKQLRVESIPPEDARFVLPNACRTEIVCTYNLHTWQHIIRERALNKHAQWEIRGIFSDILHDFRNRWPLIFGDPV